MVLRLFIINSFLLIYHYLLFPVILWLLSRTSPKKHQVDNTVEPSVTMIISAKNEEKSIRRKIQNSLDLDYPRSKFSLVVVSDKSSDNTDSIVRKYADKGVKLIVNSEGSGKTAGINRAMESISTEIVVFSDANSMYSTDAIRKMVRHFADPHVGFVVGYQRYENISQTAAGNSEAVYWNIEFCLKKWSSDISSVVGGDGAIYAIKKELYEPLLETDINDFVNPLQIVAKGYRGVFEPEAVCFEKPSGDFSKEFDRKVRITNRSFNGLLRVPQACNPFRVGIFAWQLVSYKLLRWISPYLMIIHFLSTVLLPFGRIKGVLSFLFTMGYSMLSLSALAGMVLKNKREEHFKILHLAYYFSLVQTACAIGIWKRIKGEVIVTWNSGRQELQEGQYTSVSGDKSVLSVLLIVQLLALIRVIFLKINRP